ncbi:MAG: SidA/IucD/PvdA family monooxygenase, partial [Flavisolibacter sp.]|nr:SidA/IucD/PvdA family monooxygenase [Flavisolibacter sp.]
FNLSMSINKKIYDIIGIGIGPFNLGLAAMLENLPQLSSIFFDQSPGFNWHPGMLLPNARLQVPFYADLTTIVDPCSKFTFLNYLKQKQRLFRFAIHENNFITRREYNDYCKWAAEQLDNLRFQHTVVDVHYDCKDDIYTVMVHNLVSDSLLFYHAKHLVIGIGTQPNLPKSVQGINHPCIFHSSEYLFHKNDVLGKAKIAIIGSGQSAAEIFFDLLSYSDQFYDLSWFTRSSRFYPMEYSKLSLEMTSVDYIDHFYGLSSHKKKEVNRSQVQLYKGINFSLINEIYDTLYLKALYDNTSSVHLCTNTDLKSVTILNDEVTAQFYHREIEKEFTHTTEALILATGYQFCLPSFLDAIKDSLQFSDDGLYEVNRNYSIDAAGKRVFVQNAELHTHGFNAPDLGMGPYRNAVILNAILGYEHFLLEKKIAFQTFGLTDVKELNS